MEASKHVVGWSDITCTVCPDRCTIYFMGMARPTIQVACAAKVEFRATKERNLRRRINFRQKGLDDTLPLPNGKNPRMARSRANRKPGAGRLRGEK
jgi:hypothetical protein